MHIKDNNIDLGINEEYKITGEIYLNGNKYSDKILVEVIEGQDLINIDENLKLTALSEGSVKLRICMEDNNEIYQELTINIVENAGAVTTYQLIGDESLKWGRTKVIQSIKSVNGVSEPAAASFEVTDKDELLSSYDINSSSVTITANNATVTVTADGEFVQVPLAQITWYHHISMFPKVKENVLRAFYITESASQGWSRDIMLMQIEDGYHKKVKSLPNNFADTLPPLKSDLAKAAFKDPYNFGFVDMTKVKQETDLEDQLTTKVTDFLLELGTGFAFVKRQFPLNIDGDESRVDLLMYHTRLHCYVAIELKVVEFQPEFISKLNYYISAIDDLVKMPEDNPTIGLLLCRSKNNTKVEYALRGMTQPLGVAAYKTKELIENLKSSLPSIDDLEKTLNE